MQSLGEEDELNTESELTVNDEDASSEESPTVTIRPIPDSGFEENDFEIITIERNPQLAEVEYTFPVTRITEVHQDISIADINIYTIERAAKRVTSTGDILIRKEIVASLGKGIS